MSKESQLLEVKRLRDQGWGNRKIGAALGIGKDAALRLLKKLEFQEAKNGQAVAVAEIEPHTAPEFAQRINACWRRSREDLVEAGRLLCAAKEALDHGEFQAMIESSLDFKQRMAEMLMSIYRDPRLSNPQHVALLPNTVGTLYELTRLKDDAFAARIADGTIRPDMERKEAETLVRGNGPSRSMKRTEPADSFDPFFTPPWATRALMKRVLPQLGMHPKSHTERTIWEPACGEGHMSGVLQEYSEMVFASDIHQYGENTVQDFLTCEAKASAFQWIITNPPFRGDMAERFVLTALELAYEGVAMFVALQFLETVGRFDPFFKERPPTLISFFAERVNCCKGRWDPDGSTDAAYVWLVWKKDREP